MPDKEFVLGNKTKDLLVYSFLVTKPIGDKTMEISEIVKLLETVLGLSQEEKDDFIRECIEKIFQSTRPARGATAKVNKFLCTFLQKKHGFQIILRKTLPFKAFCRLQIGKNFSICGANRCGNFCELLLRTIRSSVLPEGRSACSQNAQFYSHTFSRDNRNADCLFPDP